MKSENNRGWRSQSGRSLVETLAVIAIAALLTAMAVPQMLSARRLIRSNALPREIATQLRFTRQQAMSQRQAMTFQYDDSTKTIKIYDHNNNNNGTPACNMTGVAVLSAGGYPNTSCSTNVLTIPLATGPLPPADLSYGIPSGINSNTALDDGNTMTALAGTVVNITFQPDGTVIDSAGNYAKPTLFFYNNQIPTETATAISVLGAAGRIKVWRYSSSASKYTE
jgi:type II secretory pathway pseudopilin PulG